MSVTHGSTQSKNFDQQLEIIRARIQKQGDDEIGPVTEKLDCLEELSKGAFGQFLLMNRGVNGYWSDVAYGRIKMHHPPLQPIEKFMTEHSPLFIARYEALTIAQRRAQKLVENGCIFASLPSGRMRELLELDYSDIEDFKLVACDLDAESLASALDLAKSFNLDQHLDLHQLNAWDLTVKEEFSLITCLGLTTYVSDDAKLLELYTKLHAGLKPGGTLITSHPTPASCGNVDRNCEWDLSKINENHLRRQRIIQDVVQPLSKHQRGSELICDLLRQAGFAQICVQFDTAKMYPVYVAAKLK